jgi:riboflavin kinase/FMN adenylyltransferase
LEYFAGSRELNRTLPKPVVTVGNFDGLHLGHRAITDTVVERARSIGGTAVVYTFEPHPRRVLSPHDGPKLLTTLEQKTELIAASGIDVLIVEPFDTEFSWTTAEDFVRIILHERIQPAEVYVGYDFRFGRDRAGSMRMLTELGPRLGFAVTIIPEVTVDEGDVNSTRIRTLLSESRVGEASGMLGRPYSIRGDIVEGDRRGRTIGFPTANVAPENEILPQPGVYAGRMRFLDAGPGPPIGEVLPAVTNVGVRPTFAGDGRVQAEAHLIDFEGDVYGRRVDLSFVEHLRPERHFPGVEELKKQIASDVAEASRVLVLP